MSGGGFAPAIVAPNRRISPADGARRGKAPPGRLLDPNRFILPRPQRTGEATRSQKRAGGGVRPTIGCVPDHALTKVICQLGAMPKRTSARWEANCSSSITATTSGMCSATSATGARFPRIDIATGYFEIGSLLALEGEWQGRRLRILMGDEVSAAPGRLSTGGQRRANRLDDSLEAEKVKDDFLGRPRHRRGDPVGQDQVPRLSQGGFHAKAYITHAAWKSSARRPWSVRPTSPTPASPRTSN